MKKSKRIAIAILTLVLVFAFAGCKANNDEDANESTNSETSVNENVETPDDNEEADNEEADNEEAKEAKEENDETDPVDAMIEEADYISKIKLITKGKDNKEIKVLDNIKGNLTESDLPNLMDLEENRAYVVFLKDEDNKVVLIDDSVSIILLEGDNHKLFEKINKKVHGK